MHILCSSLIQADIWKTPMCKTSANTIPMTIPEIQHLNIQCQTYSCCMRQTSLQLFDSTLIPMPCPKYAFVIGVVLNTCVIPGKIGKMQDYALCLRLESYSIHVSQPSLQDHFFIGSPHLVFYIASQTCYTAHVPSSVCQHYTQHCQF